MDNTILQTINNFETFSLAELEAANLLERKDFKYTFHVKHLPFILEKIKLQIQLRGNVMELCHQWKQFRI